MPAEGLPARLTEFVTALRDHGLQVGTAETVDAAAAVEVLGLASREQLRHGLAASLLRRDGHRGVFDAVFDVYFPAAVGLPAGAASASASLAGDGRPDLQAMREMLLDALADGDPAELARLAGAAVEAFGGLAGRPGQGAPSGWSAMRTLQVVQPQTLIARVEQALQDGDPFVDRLMRDEARRRVRDFEEMVRTEARRRQAEVRDASQVARYAAKAADVADFLSADRKQLAELRRTVQPLSRRLATRLGARRRRHSRGAIDVRRTFRRSMSTGGVPITPAYRRRRRIKPDIVLLCDVSGSVAGFADFTLMLVEALHDQFSRVRAFAFVDSADEITDLVADNDADPGTLIRRITAERAVVTRGGHSDYAHALRGFADEHLTAVGPRTSVLILGDARNNGGDPALPALRRIVDAARHVYWLNPEPVRSWGSGDSLAPRYREVVEMHECRNAQQLAAVVSRLLPI